MIPPTSSDGSHPEGEPKFSASQIAEVAEKVIQTGRRAVDVHGGRTHVEWDPHAPVTPLGQLVYFRQFLATGGVYAQWVADCPLCYVSRLRLALDVVVAAGKQSHSQAVSPGLWSWWERLPEPCRPHLMRMDCGFGNEGFLVGCEERLQKYLSRLRLTKGVREIIRALSRKGGWKACGSGWEGLDGELRLKGWTRSRRVVVLRRRVSAKPLELGPESGLSHAELLEVKSEDPYEYTVLVTNTDWELLTLARLYRERADSENTIDELKRQWGWGGFVTKDLLRCQVAARAVALIYNWWSLFVRCVEPSQPREAVTSRPLLMYAVGRQVSHAGQTTVILTSMHGEAGRVQEILTNLSLFLSGLRNTAEQLSASQCWQRIWERILTPFRALEAACRILFGQEAKLSG